MRSLIAFAAGLRGPRFAYNVTTDPVSGATDGLLRRCLATSTCPKIMQVDANGNELGGLQGRRGQRVGHADRGAVRAGPVHDGPQG